MIVLSFDHKFVFIFKSLSDSLGNICHFSPESVVKITHEQNIICSQTPLEGTTHERTILCRQLFAGHEVGSPPMEMEEKMHRMVIIIDTYK